jgi:cellulose synthase operon protein C
VKKPYRRAPAPSASIDALVARAAEALRQERFREAIDLFKLLLRQEPRPEWKRALADAYHGRARDLAAKRMFKEAAMVLENALAPDGTLHDPLFYLECLIRDGQQQKAAMHALIYIGRDAALPVDSRAALEELTAALLVAVPLRPDPTRPGPAERTRWLELAATSREALDAWVSGAPAEEVERHLNRISLRSAFRPVRLLLKSLLGGLQETDRSRWLLEAITPGSPFLAFREAVEAVISGEQGIDAENWHRLTRVQQAFVAEARDLPASASQFLAHVADAARAGPAALYNFLSKQTEQPQAEIRSACLNLLPQIPDRLAQFEQRFGPLSPLERNRIQALAAERRDDWDRAERFWRAAASSVPSEDPQAGLMRGVIFRHLADLAAAHPQIKGDPDDFPSDPIIHYLEQSREADPDYVPAVLKLIGQYRKDDRPKDWHRLAEEVVQRFPDNSAVLQQATESAVARKAYKKAAGFARRLLQIDPINAGVRRQMIELQVAHARKQMRARRPDLATRELGTAYEWERPDAPNALLRIAHGLIGLQAGEGEWAEARLQEGVALAGGGAAGWFRAALETELMRLGGGLVDRLRKELAQARVAPPTREAVLSVMTALGQPEATANRKAVASLLLGMRPWLLHAAAFDWLPAEFHVLAETFARFEAFNLLQEYARAARQRDVTNSTWRFYEIVARTRGDVERLSMSEMNELTKMADAAVDRKDFHAANRIERFLSGESVTSSGRRRSPPGLPNDLDGEAMEMLIEAFVSSMAKGSARDVRALVEEFGPEGAASVMVERLRDSPLGGEMPERVLRELCAAMVAQAMTANTPGRGGTVRRRRA